MTWTIAVKTVMSLVKATQVTMMSADLPGAGKGTALNDASITLAILPRTLSTESEITNSCLYCSFTPVRDVLHLET